MGGVTIRMAGAMLQLLNGMRAQAGALGNTLLGESKSQAVVTEQLRE